MDLVDPFEAAKALVISLQEQDTVDVWMDPFKLRMAPTVAAANLTRGANGRSQDVGRWIFWW